MQKLLTFFSAKNINVFAILQDRNFNVTLANNFINFLTTAMGPGNLFIPHEDLTCDYALRLI